MRSRSRLRISPRTGASERSEVAPGVGKETLNRRAEAVSAQRLSADGPEHQTKADERSVRGFLRSRSHPWKSPRPGSRSEATSAGTGQNKGDFSRRVAPVAAKRSSGAARRRRGSPSGADGRGCKSARRNCRGTRPRRAIATAREGGGIQGRQRCTKPVRSDASARPRRLQRCYQPHGKPEIRRVQAKRGRAGSGKEEKRPEGHGSHREARVCRRIYLVLCRNGNNQA